MCRMERYAFSASSPERICQCIAKDIRFSAGGCADAASEVANPKRRHEMRRRSENIGVVLETLHRTRQRDRSRESLTNRLLSVDHSSSINRFKAGNELNSVQPCIGCLPFSAHRFAQRLYPRFRSDKLPNMNATSSRALISIEDYLGGELHSSIKHEYLGGQVYAMAGASNGHNLIAMNIAGFLFGRLHG